MKSKPIMLLGIVIILMLIVVLNQSSIITFDFLGNKGSDNNTYQGNYFAIHLIDETVEYPGKAEDLSSIKLQDNPIISDDDILEYDFDEHALTITESCYNRLLEREDIFSRYFMVVAKGENICIGMFRRMVHSFIPNTAVIYLDNFEGIKVSNGKGIDLSIISPYSSVDMRSDKRIEDALKDSKLIK